MVKSRVKERMVVHGLTIEELAYKTGLKPDTIKRARQDVGACRGRTKEAIAQALGCEVRDLLGEEKG